MTERDNGQSLLHDGLYKKAVKEIGTLREKLPEDAFATLAREVIRRLSDHPVAASRSIAFPNDATIDDLARALMQPDLDTGVEFIERVRAQGASVETVYLAYLAEAAKKMGEWWEEDEVSFVDVTFGTGHIYAIMRGLKPLFRAPLGNISQPKAFLLPFPEKITSLACQWRQICSANTVGISCLSVIWITMPLCIPPLHLARR